MGNLEGKRFVYYPCLPAATIKTHDHDRLFIFMIQTDYSYPYLISGLQNTNSGKCQIYQKVYMITDRNIAESDQRDI